MRTLSASLTTAQKSMGAILCKIVLTGAQTYTYATDTANLLLKVQHSEMPYSQTAKVTIDNSDNTLTALSLEGYTGTISYGYTTTSDEYSATAPLRVKGQSLTSIGGQLQCVLDLYGIPDQLKDDHASVALNPASTDTTTVQTYITAIAGATQASYSHCAAFTVTYDSTDSLIGTFAPADYFRIGVGDDRLDKIRELLSFTKCVMRAGADGAIHVLSPTVSGVVYDYEYNDTDLSTNHTFFSKVYRNRLVLPNDIVVMSSPNQEPPLYTGDASDATSYALLPKRDYRIMRLTSTAQAEAIAAAIIQRLQTDHQKGNGYAPMNVGQEVHDYIKITDAREGDNRVGNIGYITRNFDIVGRSFPFGMGFSFGDINLGGSIGIMATSGDGTIAPSYVSYSDLNATVDEIYVDLNKIIDILNMRSDFSIIQSLTVTEELNIPTWS